MASEIKWGPGIEGLRKRVKLGTACEMEYNKRTGEMTLRRPFHDQQEMKEVAMTPPSQLHMTKDHTEYSEDELHHVAQGVASLLTEENLEESSKSLDPIEESYPGFSGYSGQIKVYDSENRDQLLFQNYCCELSKGIPIRCHCDGFTTLCWVLPLAFAAVWIFAQPH